MVKFYKDDQEIDLTPELAISHQGGTSTNPWQGLIAGGWSQTNPNVATPAAPATPTPTPGSGVDANGDGLDDASGAVIQKVIDSDYEDLKKLEKEAGILTAEEEAAIKQQAQQEGLKYDILLKEAAEKKRQGVATGTVAAGQRGGFESSQLAGAAALSPTVGGTWAGQGGALEKIVSAYDQNISNLEVQKQQAINTAREALREYKLTGKSDAFKRAKDMYEMAQKSQADAVDLAYKKVQTLKAQQDLFKSQVEFKADNIANNIVGQLTGDQEKDSTLIADQALANGLNSGDINAALRKIQDEQSFYKSSDLLAIAKTLPTGQSKTIKDPNTGRTYTIEGIAGAGEVETIQATDDQGRISIIDKNTGEVINRTAPGVGKTKTGPSMISVNYPSLRQETLFDSSGKEVGTAWSNPIQGTTIYKDKSQNIIPNEEVIAKGYTVVKKTSSKGSVFGSIEDLDSTEE